MSQVTLSIGNRKYTVACAAGEEAHVARLGAAVDVKLREMGSNLAPQEAQNLLFAALLIAEDLHQIRNSATVDNGELDTLRDQLATAERERQAALGQHDQLRETLAERERELDALQRAVQASAHQADDIRAEITRLRSELEDAEQVEAELRAGLSGLVEERDALQEELEEMRNRPSTASTASAMLLDPDLAPALEQFADLLENCADKLEGKARAS